MTNTFSSLRLQYMGLVLLVPMPSCWLLWIPCWPQKLPWMGGGQVAGHQASVHLFNPSGEKKPHCGLGTTEQNIFACICCVGLKFDLFFFLSPEIIVFVSQLPLMMQPCFASKPFGDFRINIKKERLKKPLKVFSHKWEWQKTPTMLLWQFLNLCVKAIS